MSLLHQIQESVVQENRDLGSVLLRLRLLASRLGSHILEEWVKHESEGYPNKVDEPSYRIVGVSYKVCMNRDVLKSGAVLIPHPRIHIAS